MAVKEHDDEDPLAEYCGAHRLLGGDAIDSGAVVVQAFNWPAPERPAGGLVGLALAVPIRWRRRRKRDTVALYPLGSTKGAYPFGIVAVEVLPGAPMPARGQVATWYGVLAEGHTVAFDIGGELYFPTGPFAPAPLWAPRLGRLDESALNKGAATRSVEFVRRSTRD
jgi:hypothetical protein